MVWRGVGDRASFITGSQGGPWSGSPISRARVDEAAARQRDMVAGLQHMLPGAGPSPLRRVRGVDGPWGDSKGSHPTEEPGGGGWWVSAPCSLTGSDMHTCLWLHLLHFTFDKTLTFALGSGGGGLVPRGPWKS